MPVRVGIFGYGTIGKRVADAVLKFSDEFELVGVVKPTPDYEAEIAVSKGIKVYTYSDKLKDFEKLGIPVAGTAEELLDKVDVVIDATPGKVGKEMKEKYYAPRGKPAIFQGGEKADVADVSFNALANYDRAVGAKYIRVVSCNTTGICRLLASFLLHGLKIRKVRVYLVRRGADPKEHKRGPINDVVPDPVTVPSHHGPDVKTVIPEINIVTMAVAVPVTLMHLHMVNIEFETNVTREDIIRMLEETPRIMLVPTGKRMDSIAQLIEWARDIGRYRNDIMENCIFEGSITVVDGNDVYLSMAIHQESIVIPENIDALRAMFKLADKWTSIEKTDKVLGLITSGKKYKF